MEPQVVVPTRSCYYRAVTSFLTQFAAPDRAYALAFIIVYVSLMVIRITFRARSGDLARSIINRDEGLANIVGRWVLGSALIASIVAYFLVPGLFPWFFLPVSATLRTIAVVVAVLCLALLAWTHLTLRAEFSTTLRLTTTHRLITSGPYRFIQHPMYLAFFLLFGATGLFTRSWVIGLLGMATIGTLMTSRRRREEAMLLDRFGDDYVSYQLRTSRFIPRLPHRGWIGGSVRRRVSHKRPHNPHP